MKRGPSLSLAASGVFLEASGVLSLLDPPLQEVLNWRGGGGEGGGEGARRSCAIVSQTT